MDIRELPDIPGLEAVDSRSGKSAAAVTFLCVLCAVNLIPLGVLAARYHSYLGSREKIVLMAVPVLLALLGVRVLFSFSAVRTSAEGIIQKAALRSRVIPWRSVVSASQRKSKLGVSVAIVTTTGQYTIPLPDDKTSRARVLASIWQHLRRSQVPNDIELDEAALSFWEEIGPDVPEEIDWKGPRSRSAAISAIAFFWIIVIGLLCMMAPDVMRNPWRLLQVAMLVIPMVVLARFVGPQVTASASGVRVRRDHLEADLPFRQVSLQWSDVVSVDWLEGLAISFRDDRKRTIFVPYAPGKTESETLILAIFRRLREQPHVQPIPFPLLATRHPEQLRRPTSDSKQQTRMRMAFLNTLEPGLRKKMQRLYWMCAAGVLLGFLLGLGLTFADPCVRLSEYLHKSPDTRFFFTTMTLPLGVPLMISMVLLMACVLSPLAKRLAGSDLETWIELNRIAPDSKWSKIFVGIFATLCIGAIVVCGPLMVDCYLNVANDGIAFSRFWGFGERVYTWNQVAGFNDRSYEQQTKYGSCIEHEYTVSFSDGQTLVIDKRRGIWRNDEEIPAAMDFIRAHIPLR